MLDFFPKLLSFYKKKKNYFKLFETRTYLHLSCIWDLRVFSNT